jgi:hypothetical protein
MGEVYRAQDLRLGREVALKVLPEAFAHDPERRSRFEREARLLASLNHPNIATVHGLEEVGPHSFLEMEMVPGDTLTQIFARGRLPVREALPIFRQIALALEAAHERGIIHRDLKPSNVKVMPDGRVKVLDFGLAKALSDTDPHSPASVNKTTFELSATGMGVVLGTAAYMSPEQARGKPVDRRTDIWAFGSVFYEALAGCPPFRADTFSDTLVKVLTEEPDWSVLTDVPPTIARLLRRCLRKELQGRLRDIADARLEIEEVLSGSEPAYPALWDPISTGTRDSRDPTAAAQPRRSVPLVATIAAASLGLGVAAGWLIARGTVPTPTSLAVARRLAVPLPVSQRLVSDLAAPIAAAPDGSAIVYAATEGDSRTRLLLRRLDQFYALPVDGTDGASAPFFSRDGRWIGFHASGALQKVALAGGAPLRIAETPPIWSAFWGRDDTILFSTALPGDGIWKVNAVGGQPERVTTPDATKGELRHATPQLLPGGGRALFSVLRADGWSAAIVTLDTKQVMPVAGRLGGAAHYVPGGRLVFAQDGGLVAVPFDADRGELGSSPVPMLERVATGRLASAFFAVSSSGALVYVPADRVLPARTLIVVDRGGRAEPLSDVDAPYAYPRFARDGRRLAVSIASENGSDIWVYDLTRGTRGRLTTGGMSTRAIWSMDGSRLAFAWKGPATWSLYAKSADGSGVEQPLIDRDPPVQREGWVDPLAGVLPGSLPQLTGAHLQSPSSWVSSGPMAFTEHKPTGEHDIWVLTLGQGAVPFLVTPFDEAAPEFSPDGRLLAYASDESGRHEVYVQPYPGPGGKWLVSTAGGTDPVWSANGRELFYRRGDAVMSVAVTLTPAFSAGTPRELFTQHDEITGDGRNYDVSPDGRRFVMVQGARLETSPALHVVLNWLDELTARTAAGVEGGR